MSAEPTLKLVLYWLWAVGVAEIVRFLKTKVPALLIPEFASFIVTVPALGEKFPEPPTVRLPLTVNESAVVVVPLKVTLLKVKVPEAFEIEPPVKVTVLLVGAKVMAPERVKAPPTEKSVLY